MFSQQTGSTPAASAHDRMALLALAHMTREQLVAVTDFINRYGAATQGLVAEYVATERPGAPLLGVFDIQTNRSPGVAENIARGASTLFWDIIFSSRSTEDWAKIIVRILGGGAKATAVADKWAREIDVPLNAPSAIIDAWSTKFLGEGQHDLRVAWEKEVIAKLKELNDESKEAPLPELRSAGEVFARIGEDQSLAIEGMIDRAVYGAQVGFGGPDDYDELVPELSGPEDEDAIAHAINEMGGVRGLVHAARMGEHCGCVPAGGPLDFGGDDEYGGPDDYEDEIGGRASRRHRRHERSVRRKARLKRTNRRTKHALQKVGARARQLLQYAIKNPKVLLKAAGFVAGAVTANPALMLSSGSGLASDLAQSGGPSRKRPFIGVTGRQQHPSVSAYLRSRGGPTDGADAPPDMGSDFEGGPYDVEGGGVDEDETDSDHGEAALAILNAGRGGPEDYLFGGPDDDDEAGGVDDDDDSI